MRATFYSMTILLASILLASCSDRPKVPKLTLTSVGGSTIELNENTPLTALFFFSMNNPVALGAFNNFPDQLDDTADSYAIAMHVDRPPNVVDMQQRTLVPIVIDETNRIAEAFGGINLTPTLILLNKGKVLLHQRGQLDYVAVNTIIRKQQ